MEDNDTIPINESVCLLSLTSKESLETLRKNYPFLVDELKVGVKCGRPKQESDEDKYLAAKIDVALNALNAGNKAIVKLSRVVSERIAKAKKLRLISQVVVLIGSSSLMSSTVWGNDLVRQVIAILTFLAALSSTFAEYYEKLLNPKKGDIYTIHEKLVPLQFQVSNSICELGVLRNIVSPEKEKSKCLKEANGLCALVIELIAQFPSVQYETESITTKD